MILKMVWLVFFLISCVKLLFVPAYRSTDFEVHRNWLAITHTLPVSKWYYENTSEWTLDYPPLFAWFEYALSKIAIYFDPKMLDIKNLNYASYNTILFQRLSVIVADAMLAYGTKECCAYLRQSGVRKSSRWGLPWGSPSSVLSMLLLANAGLLLEQYVSSAFWFALLLNLKHIFLYIAPAYAVYLLRNYCMVPAVATSTSPSQHSKYGLCLRRIILLASVGAVICLVFSRLFPFKRGLCHSYWAPNFWALYNTADKVSLLLGRQFGFKFNSTSASMTGGLVQEFEHSVLPTITPATSFICSLLAILPAMIKLWFSPHNPLHFVRCVILCAYGAFMFGWHVHEKAVLLIIIPLSILSVVWKKEARSYLLLSTLGHYSLTPLIFTPFEMPLKALLVASHATYAFLQLHQMFNVQGYNRRRLPLLSCIETLYILGLIPLFLYENVIHNLLWFSQNLPFLPLMLTSVYCAAGIFYCWCRYYWHFLSMGDGNYKRKVH
ncbi:hypothetical protein B566_EDAN003103 [Ephemera danica]|nr:hypothetical protein B566_EDAN003103 [Ephemera danica]